MADFFDVCREIRGNTLVTPDRLWNLWSWINDTVQSLEGEVAELGSYKGGSAKLLAKAIGHSRKIHIFDTFEGVPKELTDPKIDYVLEDHPHLNINWAGGVYQGGEWVAPYEKVKKFLKDCPSVIIHKGMVPDTLPEVGDDQFCFVYLDMDIYQPTVDALNFFWPRLVSKGVIMLDDFGHLQGVTDAITKFAEEKGVQIIHTCYMQCAIRKP
jgi:O-methyltransferase